MMFFHAGQGMRQDVLRAQLEVSMLLDKPAAEERKRKSQAAMSISSVSVIGRSEAEVGDTVTIIINFTVDTAITRNVVYSELR
ncbi:MAG: hypothetical protein M0R70_04500 [Nitrospirae bacterium]|nr:hypothetical protein [Nitrospirota bacterium]